MKKSRWIWIGSIAGLFIIGGIIYFFVSKNLGGNFEGEFDDFGIPVQKASEQKLGESILVTGQVIPEDEQKIFLDIENGDVKEYLVEENQKVVAGEALFTYDTTEIDAEYNKAVRARDLMQKQLKIEQSEIAAMDKQIATIRKK